METPTEESAGYIAANWATWACARCAWTVPPAWRTEHGCIAQIRLHIAMHRLGDPHPTPPPAALTPEPLTDYMMATTTVARDAAFLRLYAAKIRNGTEVMWEIPNTRASTIEDIAKRIESPPPARADAPEGELEHLRAEVTHYREAAMEVGCLDGRFVVQLVQSLRAEVSRLTEALEQATRERDEFHMAYRIQCDRESKAALIRAEKAEATCDQAGALVTLREKVQNVIDAYGDQGWAKSDMCRYLRAALAASAPAKE